MKSFVLAAALCGVVASTTSAAIDQGWDLDVSGNQPSSLTNITFVNEDGSNFEVPMMAAQTGFGPEVLSDGVGEKPGNQGTVSGGGEGDLPTVPLPAPVLMAALGLVAVVLGRNQLSRFAGR